jgi:hypothetical protein
MIKSDWLAKLEHNSPEFFLKKVEVFFANFFANFSPIDWLNYIKPLNIGPRFNSNFMMSNKAL